MTVKEITSLMTDVKEIRLGYEGLTSPFNKDDNLAMAAFGKFVVASISALDEDVFEITLATQLVAAE